MKLTFDLSAEFACFMEFPEGRFRFSQTLVGPVPDGAALEEAFFFEKHPVVVEVAGGVAHGVVVFAENEGALVDEGFLFFGAGVFLAGFEGGIHGGEEIDVGLLFGTFVVDGVLHGRSSPDPFGTFFEADAIARFVAEGPHDDGGVVLDGMNHVGDAIKMGGGPGGVFGERFFFVAHAVGFDVRFGDDVEAVFVAEFVEAGIVGIVGGADGVDVELLHEFEVLAHAGFGDVVAGVRIVVVAVDSFDEDGLSVDEELAIFDFGRFESDPVGIEMGGLFPKFADADDEGVEVGFFGRPRGDFESFGDDLPVGKEGRVWAGVGNCFWSEDDGAVGLDEVESEGDRLRGVRLNGGEGEAAGAILVEGGINGVVGEGRFGDRAQIDVAEDAGEAPKVLALEVCPIRVSIDLDGEGVGAFFQEGREVELGGSSGVLRVADFLAVAPEIEGGGNAIEGDGGLAILPIGGESEGLAIGGDGVAFFEGGEVVFGFAHDAGWVFFEGVSLVEVDGRAVALEFDVGGHGDGFPGGVIEV